MTRSDIFWNLNWNLGREVIKMTAKQHTAQAEVSLEDIDKRLRRIEKMLSTTIPQLKKEGDMLIKEAESIKKEEKLIEAKEEQLEKTESALLEQLGERVPRKFSDIMEWKTFVWDKCRFKQHKEGAKTIDYFCTKLNGPCRFETCPMNR